MPKSVFAYIWRYSRLQQIILTLVTLFSFPFLYYSLDLPKLDRQRSDRRRGLAL